MDKVIVSERLTPIPTTFLTPSVTAQVGASVSEVSGGRLTLASLEVPYATADVAVPLDSDMVLDGLDPRDNIRVVVSGSAGGATRTFDLGLREREVDYAGKVVRLALASDEALLQDYATLADDATPLTMQGSLRSIVNYVLGKVIPGAALAAGTDVAMPALSPSQNLVRNPRVANNSNDWLVTWASGGAITFSRSASGGPSYAPAFVQAYANNAATNGAYIYADNATLGINGGETYEYSVDVQGTAGLPLSIDGLIFDSASNVVGVTKATTFTATGSWQRVTLQFATPASASRFRPRINVVGQMPYGGILRATAMRLSKSTGDRVADALYFDGDTADTAQYDYTWTDAAAAHATVSNRAVKVAQYATPAALIWSAGVYAWDFLTPLCNVAGMRLFCDEHRVWRLVIPGDYAVAGLVEVSGYNAAQGTDRISRNDPDVFATGVVVRYIWEDASGNGQTKIDAAGTPGRVVVIDYARPYPGPGAAAAILARRDGTGRSQSVTALVQWAATPAMGVSITMPLTPRQSGKVSRVEFALDDSALMLLDSLGLIDIPDGSWAATPPTEKWTDAPNPLAWSAWT